MQEVGCTTADASSAGDASRILLAIVDFHFLCCHEKHKSLIVLVLFMVSTAGTQCEVVAGQHMFKQTRN